jgi:NADH-quinone oxidoreductase subunit H
MFNIDPNLIVDCTTNGGCSLIHAVVFSIILFFLLTTSFAYSALLERKLLAWIQARVGPNRVGPFGLLQPLAEGLKLMFKEDIIPSGADRPVFWLAPVIKVIPAVMVVAVVPLGPPLLIPWFDGLWYRVTLNLANVNVGVLYILAFLSLGSYGIALAGWSSNNKYALMGGIRATAQLISYELSMGLTMAVPVLLAGSMNMRTIIDSQVNPPILSWYIFQNPLSAVVLLIALFAETNRAPFDLPEADTELTAGFITEYSGMKFALFFMGEYISMIAVAIIFASLYLGGYHFILADQVPILGPVVLAGKVLLVLFIMIWVRATVPRVRYDRLMQFGWKVMMPLALLGIAWSSIASIVGDTLHDSTVYLVISAVFLIALVIVLLARTRPKPETVDSNGVEVIDLEHRHGIGYLIMNIVGAVLSAPAALRGAGRSDK